VEIEWTGSALDDMADLDKGIARRVKNAVERFADTGPGRSKNSRVSILPSTGSVSAIIASASNSTRKHCACFAYATAARPVAEERNRGTRACAPARRHANESFDCLPAGGRAGCVQVASYIKGLIRS